MGLQRLEEAKQLDGDGWSANTTNSTLPDGKHLILRLKPIPSIGKMSITLIKHA